MMQTCRETQKYLEEKLPGWTFKVGRSKTTVIIPEGDVMEMAGFSGLDDQTLYKAAVRFGDEQRLFADDSVIQDLERQIEERKKYLKSQPTRLVKEVNHAAV